MVDFLMIATKTVKRGVIDIYPKFLIKKSNDLMIRGGDFYAVWIEERGIWSTDEQDALQLIDKEIDIYVKENADKFEGSIIRVLHMWDAESGMIDRWHKYCQKQMRDWYHQLDDKLIFSNTETRKKDYASRSLSYPLEKTEIPAYDELMSVLYSKSEREKLEWAIGSIVSGDSKKIQKFVVLYGAAGTGKSTVLNIIQQLFEGYYCVFDAKALGSSNNSFALEAFSSNPLVAIQHDGDLSRIEDNTRLNSLVSHEVMTVNEKFKSTYSTKFKSFLFMGTNKPVKITDSKSGLLRRLIDVSPSGEKVHHMRYNKLIKQISFELGGIAYHCREVYLDDPNKYDSYVPISMLGATNDFYDFVLDSYLDFKNSDTVSLQQAWAMYKEYCTEANVLYPMGKRIFKEELKNYFDEFIERSSGTDGIRIRNVYKGFKKDKFVEEEEPEEKPEEYLIKFSKRKSIFDKECSDCYAQYASDKGTPVKKWDDVSSKLSEIDTSELHYVKVPLNHIVIDFDIPGEDGEKSYERNLKEASKWPTTYAELSKSGSGIHLHYIYDGDPTKLAREYESHIEIKVFNGKSSLRRKLTKCNGEPINHISAGLPLKGDKQVVNFEGFKNEKGLHTLIVNAINKEYHGATKPNMDLIFAALEDAYNNGLKYNVEDLRPAVFIFASRSTHNAEYCMSLLDKMHFKSDSEDDFQDSKEPVFVFYDIEVLPNLLLICYKKAGENEPVMKMFNPSSEDIDKLLQFRLIGFNCRRYDNHILYGRWAHNYTNEQMYRQSKAIISGDKSALFGGAYNLSYTDVYDFSSKKQSLKKFEIELGIHHQELGYSWDEPMPEDKWDLLAEYCVNDVLATEAVFNARKADWNGRQILAAMAESNVNNTTNGLTTKIIFGNDKNPQSQFNYRFLGDKSEDKPWFDGYRFENGVSSYRDWTLDKDGNSVPLPVGEGGYVFANPGMYGNVALLDVASMHPTSIIQEELFGPVYTKRFKDIVDARIAIKHKDFDKARKMLGGKLAPYLNDEESASDLAYALKIAINSVYGLTSAKFANPFRDPRNRDNIVAKRGALFMIDLKYAVMAKGYTVVHIKTDSIKIADADDDIIKFVMDFGKKYGYTFEHEATYEKLCLVNKSTYIAKDAKDGHWTATGTQFQVPYVFKTLFSKEPIEFRDLCETKEVKSALYLGKEGVPEDTYRFVGKVGSFCPMYPGEGFHLYREADGKFNAATGTKGYEWMEAEMVSKLKLFDKIDRGYYDKLCNDAINDISDLGDFEWFVSEDPYIDPPFKGGKVKK